MSSSAARIPRPRLPRTFVGKNGLPVELRHLPNDAGQSLIEFYLAFQPRNCFRGLPPIQDELCRRWASEIFASGCHIVAAILGNTASADEMSSHHATGLMIVGHAAFLPVDAEKCEMLAVICPEFQNRGIGTELVRSCIGLADEHGFDKIVAPVDATNLRARHIFGKCGFDGPSNMQGRQFNMIYDLQRRRCLPIRELHGPTPRVPAPCFHFPELPKTTSEK